MVVNFSFLKTPVGALGHPSHWLEAYPIRTRLSTFIDKTLGQSAPKDLKIQS
jgi:hypothetical protein